MPVSYVLDLSMKLAKLCSCAKIDTIVIEEKDCLAVMVGCARKSSSFPLRQHMPRKIGKKSLAMVYHVGLVQCVG